MSEPTETRAPSEADLRAERTAMLALAGVRGVGPLLGRRLIERFGSARAVLGATQGELEALEGIGPKGARAILRRADLRAAERELDALREHGGRALVLGEPTYPQLLIQTTDAPLVLFCRGGLAPEDARAVAIVGTRSATPYGVRMARNLAAGLAERGVTVVSGMARGVDTEAHRAALEAGGRTIAILGSGLDIVYPAENKSLARAIADRGAVLTEFSLGTRPLGSNFPRRNRVISGIAHGVVVVEAAARSGSLITARAALDQGREVFAVPGPVTSAQSRGPNGLIRDGAKLVEGVRDILEELPALGAEAPSPRQSPLKVARAEDEPPSEGDRAPGPDPAAGLAGDERTVYEALGAEPVHVDAIVERTGLRVEQASAALLGLELAGLARQVSGARFVREADN